MASQVVAILALILFEAAHPLFILGRVALWVATITALASAVDYYRRFNDVLGGQRVPPVVPVQPVAPVPPVAKVQGAHKVH